MQATRLFQKPTQQPVLPKSIRVMEREGGKVGAEGGVKGLVEEPICLIGYQKREEGREVV